ncbi:hypothetical protein HRR75_007577 [Exophiala dermatitidis]|nr:hypothetical protein HRR75_007577 [Exophiala dermatitidis]
MSQSSHTADRPPITSPAAAGTHNPSGHASGGSAESSRPSTSSAVRPEAHGLYSGAASSARPAGEAGTAESASRTTSRPLGVHSILNPTVESEPLGNSSNIRPNPSPARSVAPSLVPAPSLSPRGRKRIEPRSPPREHDQPLSTGTRRRVLTPKSPSVRAASLGPRRNPALPSSLQPVEPGTGPGGRTYTAEPGLYRTSEIPPLPPLSMAAAQNLPSLAPLGAAGQLVTSASHVSQSPVRGIESLHAHYPSDISSVSQASYGKVEQVSPVYRYGVNRAPSQPPPGLRALPAGVTSGFHAHGPHDGYQSAQPSYQMTLDTDQGPMVVPVQLDLQQASKVADEKRKRNAGASARFRARRKEKEKEASQTIAGLQQELNDMTEERDFYLSERNYFRELHRRRAAGSTAGPGQHNVDDTYRDVSDSGSTAQRRRTGDYQPTFLGQRQTHSPSTSSSGMGFSMEPTLPLPPPSGGPGSYGPPRSMPTGPPAPPSAQSYDPFRKDPFDRTWHR